MQKRKPLLSEKVPAESVSALAHAMGGHLYPLYGGACHQAAMQSEKRAASFTISTALVTRHFRQLDDKLLQLKMVYTSGSKKGQIKLDSTFRPERRLFLAE